MSKKESSFLGMLMSLLVITLVSGLSLGYVNDLTVGPKAKAKLEKKVNALKLVLPTFDNNPVEDMKLVKSEKVADSIEIYPAYLNNEFVGAAVIGSTEKGFSGLVKIMIGFIVLKINKITKPLCIECELVFSSMTGGQSKL